MQHNFENLTIWKRSRNLVKAIYLLTLEFPKNEEFGLKSQMRRAGVSVPSNIAEGCGRNGIKELFQFLNISIGSLCELETQMYISFDLGYIDNMKLQKVNKEIIEIRRMILGFQKSLK